MAQNPRDPYDRASSTHSLSTASDVQEQVGLEASCIPFSDYIQDGRKRNEKALDVYLGYYLPGRVMRSGFLV